MSLCLPEAVDCVSLLVCQYMYVFLVSEYDRERIRCVMQKDSKKKREVGLKEVPSHLCSLISTKNVIFSK